MNTDINALESFCDRWFKKARDYNTNNLAECFDKFSTLYTIYNRVYQEVSFYMMRKQKSTGKNIFQIIFPPKKPFAPFSDKLSATQYVLQYYDKKKLQQEISVDADCRESIDKLVKFIEEGIFYFHLDYNTGLPDTKTDQRLANDSKLYDPKAILCLIYQARCNMFHGEKEFIVTQRNLLISLNALLEFITLKVYEKLLSDLKND